jgi:hypothetical protein
VRPRAPRLAGGLRFPLHLGVQPDGQGTSCPQRSVVVRPVRRLVLVRRRLAHRVSLHSPRCWALTGRVVQQSRAAVFAACLTSVACGQDQEGVQSDLRPLWFLLLTRQ